MAKSGIYPPAFPPDCSKEKNTVLAKRSAARGTPKHTTSIRSEFPLFARSCVSSPKSPGKTTSTFTWSQPGMAAFHADDFGLRGLPLARGGGKDGNAAVIDKMFNWQQSGKRSTVRTWLHNAVPGVPPQATAEWRSNPVTRPSRTHNTASPFREPPGGALCERRVLGRAKTLLCKAG